MKRGAAAGFEQRSDIVSLKSVIKIYSGWSVRWDRVKEAEGNKKVIKNQIQKSIVLNLSAGSADHEKGSDSRHGLKAGMVRHADRLE